MTHPLSFIQEFGLLRILGCALDVGWTHATDGMLSALAEALGKPDTHQVHGR